MNAAFEPAIVWWNTKTDRERLMLQSLAVVAVIIGFWFGVMAPLDGLASKAEEKQTRAAALLAQAQSLARAMGPTAEDKPSAGAVLAEASVRGVAADAGVLIARAEQHPFGLTIWTEPVAAKPLFAWLSSVQRDQGLGVREFEAHRGEVGTVEARVVISGGGA